MFETWPRPRLILAVDAIDPSLLPGPRSQLRKRSVVVNPSLRWIEDAPTDLPSEFIAPPALVSLRNDLTGAIDLLGFRGTIALAVRSLEAGRPPPASLSAKSRNVLQAARVLVERGSARRASNRIDATLADSFRHDGFVRVPGLLHPFHVAALRSYFRKAIAAGMLVRNDSHCPGRLVRHNDGVAVFFHRRLTPFVSVLVGKPVKPSYSYVAAYERGAVLAVHRDREQCQFTISLLIDFRPEPREAAPWPLRLLLKDKTVEVFQQIGDALLYKGCETPHSRDPLLNAEASTSILFHYVPLGFQGTLS